MRFLASLGAGGLLLITLTATPAAQHEFWCWDADVVQAEVAGDTVCIEHSANLINCCPDPITWTVEIGDASILVEEHSQSLCFCLCCYDLSLTLTDVPAGPWNLVYRWFDTEADAWTERILEIVVPDVGQTDGPPIVPTSSPLIASA